MTKLSVSNQHASYVNTHGIAPEFKKHLSEKLKNGMFSLNMDEASSQSMDKIATRVTAQHLASRKVNTANALARMVLLMFLLLLLTELRVRTENAK